VFCGQREQVLEVESGMLRYSTLRYGGHIGVPSLLCAHSWLALHFIAALPAYAVFIQSSADPFPIFDLVA